MTEAKKQGEEKKTAKVVVEPVRKLTASQPGEATPFWRTGTFLLRAWKKQCARSP